MEKLAEKDRGKLLIGLKLSQLTSSANAEPESIIIILFPLKDLPYMTAVCAVLVFLYSLTCIGMIYDHQ